MLDPNKTGTVVIVYCQYSNFNKTGWSWVRPTLINGSVSKVSVNVSF